MTMSVSMTVNGKTVSGNVEARTLLSSSAREPRADRHPCRHHQPVRRLRRHVDGVSVKSCTMLAVQPR